MNSYEKISSTLELTQEELTSHLSNVTTESPVDYLRQENQRDDNFVKNNSKVQTSQANDFENSDYQQQPNGIPISQNQNDYQNYNPYQALPSQKENISKEGLPQFLTNITNKLKIQLIFSISVFSLLFITSITMIIVGAINSLGAGFFIIPSMLIPFTGIKLLQDIKAYRSIKKQLDQYKLNQSQNFFSIPRFVEKVNEKLHYKIVATYWIALTIYVVLGIYVTISLLFANVSFWIFTIDEWINEMYGSREVFNYVMLTCFSLLIVTMIWHVMNYVLINNKIEYIYSYYGRNIPSDHGVELSRKRAKRKYKPIFWIALLLITVIPLIVYIFSKKFRKNITTKARS